MKKAKEEQLKILVCGDRNWSDYNLIRDTLKGFNGDITIIEGEANGADKMAAEAARELGYKVESYLADWGKKGRAAGPIRNKQMLDEGKPTFLLAFHDNLKGSKGTKHMIKIALKADIKVYLLTSNKEVPIKRLVKRSIFTENGPLEHISWDKSSLTDWR